MEGKYLETKISDYNMKITTVRSWHTKLREKEGWTGALITYNTPLFLKYRN